MKYRKITRKITKPYRMYFFILGDALFPGLFCVMAALGPFALFQWYGFTLFCSLTKMNLNYDQLVIDYAHNHTLKLPSHEPSDWCFYQIPMAYSYIQNHYWNNGLFNYFTFKQIPNFILAFPILYFVSTQAWKFFKHHKKHCLRLGLGITETSGSNFDTYGAKTLPKEAFVYVAHASFLAFFAFFFMHVQVATRMICSSTPVIYWWMAVLSTPQDVKPKHKVSGEVLKQPRLGVLVQLETPENLASYWKNLVIDERSKMSKEGVWIVNYCIGYIFVGTILFANFLPWT